jgi:hypothetical protein
MLQVAARSKWSQFWVHQATIVFRFAANGRNVSFYGDCNVLTL